VSYLVLDIETVPDKDLWVDPPKDAPVPAGDTGRVPLSVPASIPIVIGVCWLDDELKLKKLGILGEGKDERGMLQDFAAFANSQKDMHVVTWNGRGFDVPCINYRSMRYGIAHPWYYQSRGGRYRYNEEVHCDLMDHLADNGSVRFIKMEQFARLIGLPGKMGVNGADVEGMYLSGKLDELRKYCLTDVVQTAFIFLRYRQLAGRLDRDLYRQRARELLEACEKDPRLSEVAARADRDVLLLVGP
jgi:hypothetical protein